MGESFKKHEQNSLIVTYQQGTSQKVRGQANSLHGPLLRRTNKQKTSQFCDWCLKKEYRSLYSLKTPNFHKIVCTRVRSRKQAGVFGSKPVKPSNFDVRIYAKIFFCAFVSFFQSHYERPHYDWRRSRSFVRSCVGPTPGCTFYGVGNGLWPFPPRCVSSVCVERSRASTPERAARAWPIEGAEDLSETYHAA